MSIAAPVIAGTEADDVEVTSTAVFRELAFFEAKRLADNPFVLAGVVLCGFVILMVGRSATLFLDDMVVTLMLFPLAGMTLIGANMSVLRPRRDGLEEQYGAMPVTPAVRTVAHVASLVVPFLYGCVIVALFPFISKLFGSIGWPNPLELLTGPVLVFCGGLVGILLARIAPRSTLAPFMVIAIGFIEAGLAAETHNFKRLAPFMPTLYQPTFVEVRPVGWHIVYLLGIAGVLAAASVARHRWDRRVAIVTAISVIVAIVGGLAQYSTPTPKQDLRAASWIAYPERFQTCRTHSAVTYCAYHGYEALIPRWRAPAEGVLALVPASVRARPLLLRQRLPASEVNGIQRQEIRNALPFAVSPHNEFLWPDDGAPHPDMNMCPSREESRCQIFIADGVAAWVVGFPLARTKPAEKVVDKTAASPELVNASGQARAVVALWLIMESTAEIRSAKRFPHLAPGTDLYSLTPCQDGPPVIWSLVDTGYARMLQRLPSETVAAKIADHWDVLVDPRTSTKSIAEMFALDPPTGDSLRPPPILEC